MFDKIYSQNNESSETTDVLSVLLPPDFSKYAISPYIGKFLRDNPKLELRIQYHSRELDKIRENYDIAIMSLNPEQISPKAKLIYTSDIVLICSSDYIKLHGYLNNVHNFDKHLIMGGNSEINQLKRGLTLFNKLNGQVCIIINSDTHYY